MAVKCGEAGLPSRMKGTIVINVIFFGLLTLAIGIVTWKFVHAIEVRTASINKSAKEKQRFCQETVNVIDTLRFRAKNQHDIMEANVAVLHAVRYCANDDEIPDFLGTTVLNQKPEAAESALKRLREQIQ